MMRLLTLLAHVFTTLTASAVSGYFDYRVFHNPEQGPYAEFVTSFEGHTFMLVPTDSGWYQSTANLTIIISQGEKIVDFRKIKVLGPEVQKGQPADFLSLERFPLANGNYSVEIILSDANDASAKEEKLTQKIAINNLSEGAFISDIEFVRAYTKTVEPNAFSKSGYDIIPYLSGYFPATVNALVYYAEVYNLHKYLSEGAACKAITFIQDHKQNIIQETVSFKNLKATNAIPLFQVTPIQGLASGDYTFVIEVRDENNQVICTNQRFFSRTAPAKEHVVQASSNMFSPEFIAASFAGQYKNADTLYQIIQSHLPIANSIERQTIDYQLPDAELLVMQSFFYSFWYNRNPTSPAEGWIKYQGELAKAEANFGTRIKKGWQSDRGRVYLQYGAPSTRVVRNHDPDYWPFEIWHYYETNNGQHDKRFLFYNTSLGTDMELLNSDMPGETVNYDWKNLVRNRSMSTTGDTSRMAGNQQQDPYSGDELEDLWYNPH